MPELPPFNPSVSVFHFTSKVSSAKIAKYKLATERGMVVNHAPTPAAKDDAKNLKRSASTSVMETNKRPRLKLSVRDPPAVDDDTIVVSKARQVPTAPLAPAPGKKRAWETAFTKQKAPKSPRAESSDLSSCDSDISAADATLPDRNKKAKDGYGDLMSYYIMDDSTDAPPEPVPPKQSTTRKNSTKAHRRTEPLQIIQHGQQQTNRSQHNPQRPSAPSLAPAAIDIRTRDPDPVPVMVRKLEALTAALTDFGGVPAIPLSPGGQDDDDGPVDNFLAMFGEVRKLEKKCNLPKSLDELAHPGTQDLPLTYGIQFIMNALRSWAEQRLAAQMNQQSQRPRTGRPKKSSADPGIQHENEFQTTNLFDTPEGRAISAFRAVVESGCLRMNTVMPLKLAKALRLLYMQIDHLINQNGKGQPQWRCLSYVAQIEANRVRVEKWRDAQVKAQEEMIRQQQLSHQTMMRQMGLPDHLTATMFYHQSGDHETSEHERRNSSTDLVRLPTNPRPNSTDARKPSGLANSYSENVKAEAAAFLPRSGQSMKFSFAPSSTAAIHAFGPQAFPSAGASASPARPVAWTPIVVHNNQAEAAEKQDISDTQTLRHTGSISVESSASPAPITSGFSAINAKHN